MEAAVDALGSDLTVTGARKVRKGIPGLKANEHFEVLATRQSEAEHAATDSSGVEALLGDAESVVDNAFAALLAQAEDEELATSPAVRHSQQRATPHPAPEVVVTPELEVAKAAGRPTAAEAPPAKAGTTEVLAGAVAGSVDERPATQPVAADTSQAAATTAPAEGAAGAPVPEVAKAAASTVPEAAEQGAAPHVTDAQRPTAPRPRTSDEHTPATKGRTATKPAPKTPAKPAAKGATAKRPAKPTAKTAAKAAPTGKPAPEAVKIAAKGVKTTRTTAAAPRPVRKTAAPASSRRSEAADVPPGWSRAALAALGLPDAVLAALPAKDPASDLDWVAAVERALSRTVPGPKTLGDEAPCVLAAHGVEGVVQMIATSLQTGLPVGVVTVDGGRVAPATATELALVLRAAVMGGRS